MSIFTEQGIPKGWTRGEVLRIQSMTGKNLTVVATIWQAEMPALESFSADDIACVEVRDGEQEAANNWIKWWHE